MDWSRTELAERLAAEYVLGTLRGPARRRFEALLPAHPVLRQAVAQWQMRLLPLHAGVEPVAPSREVWPAIQARLFGAPGSAALGSAASAPGWWQRLALWRGVAAFATVAAIGLGVLLSQPQPVAPPLVIVLNANPDAQGVQPVSFVASVTPDGRALVLKPLGGVPLDAGRALELWAVPGTGAPRSLGLVSGERATTVLRTRLLEGTAAFAVSIEPAGGSPTGAPSGPIVSVGKLQS
jgi:anti-sigma-K factor RskA